MCGAVNAVAEVGSEGGYVSQAAEQSDGEGKGTVGTIREPCIVKLDRACRVESSRC